MDGLYTLRWGGGGSDNPSPEQGQLLDMLFNNIGYSPDRAAQEAGMENLARRSFDSNFSEYVTDWNDDMRTPSLGEIQTLLDRMKKACGCARYNKQ